MREYRLDPNVGDVEEMDELFEISRDTEEYEIFHVGLDNDDCMD